MNNSLEKYLKNKKIHFLTFFFIIISICASIYFSSTDKKKVDATDEVSFEELEKLENKEVIETIEPEKPELKEVNKTKNEKKNLKENLSKETSQKNEKQKNEESNPKELVSDLHQGLKKISSGNILNYKEIIKLVQKTYDTEKMLKMIIGDVWKNSSSDEQKQLINVFEEYISINYIKRFSKIEEPVFQFLENKNVANFLMIKTQLVLKQNEKIPISYLLTKKGEKWKIFDVLLAGSVSEIATKKSEFNAFLKDGKIDSLLEALRKKNKLLLKN